ncbi:uncharacterized protein LOC120848911 [Ixodes scapularis]|uniref:uncharacterized protein LOC120848911 n=1 Tax=Ixodes scapularis TaxID=6945 RepID=UPI001C38F5FC|nr:uncharacterized protein LOC120848911 [Ixodes scapularis]
MTSSSSSSSGPTAFPPPAVFLAVPGPPIVAWPAWKRAFLTFLDASALHLVEPFRKKAILFSLLGTEGQRIVDAFQLYETVAVEGTDEFQVFLEAVEKHFEFSGSIALERQKLRGLFQRPGQSVTEFLAVLRHQASFCALGNALDERLCEVFLEGLESRRVQDRVLQECEGSELPTLSRAIQIARQYEQRAKTAASFRRRESQVPVAAEVQRVQIEKRQTAATQDGGQASSSFIEHGKDGYSGYPPWPQPGYPPSQLGPRMPWAPVASGHVPRFPARVFQPQRGREPAPPRTGGIGADDACYFCGRRRHDRAVCPASQATCFLCGKWGHFAVACQSRRPPAAAFTYDRRQASFPVQGRGTRRTFADRQFRGDRPGRVNVVGQSLSPEELPSVRLTEEPVVVGTAERREGGSMRRDAFMAEITVNGTPLRLLVDTGSCVSILNERMFNEVNKQRRIKLHPPSTPLVHYLQETIPVLGCFVGQVIFKNRWTTLEFYVTKTGRSLLGIDAVRELQLVLNGAKHECLYANAAHGGGASQRDVRPMPNPQRRPFTASSCQASQVPGSRPAASSRPSFAENPSPASSVSEETTPKVFEDESSPQRHPESRGLHSPQRHPESRGLHSPQRHPEKSSPSTSLVGGSSKRDTSKLPPGFEDFEHLFSPGLGLLKNYSHKVKVRHTVPPVQSKLRRLPMTLRDRVSEEIFKLEREGVIERVEASEWVSPIVVVRKPDGNIRMCVDLRAPNQAVVIDSFPLPCINELLNSLRGAAIFSKLDLASAYHQVRLDPVSRDLTSFITHEGLFRFKRVCFGLASAPAAFQQLMSKILRDCPGVQFYLDDIIVYGSTLKEHDENLRRVLSRISQAGMKLNRKGVFQVQELSFLGHHLSVKGLAPLSSKVDAVLNFATPSDAVKLRAFLGLVEYYSKFIPHCSTIVEPMRRLLRKGVRFNWSPEVEASFQKVKTSIQEAPILAMFDPTLPIVVATDASQYGLGAVLQQQYGSQLRPVAFASRSLTDAERRYSTGEKEALACLWACEKWHVYLWGRSFVIRTDHQALVTLLSNKGSGIRPLRITRWSSRLLNYNFKMEFQKGATNVVADAFSRLPVSDTEEGMRFDEEVVSVVMVPLSKGGFQQATANDIVLPSVIRYTTSVWPEDSKTNPDLRPYYHVRDQLSLYDGILYKGEKLVVPVEFRDRIVEVAHEVHQGITRTTSVIREHYWWPLMNEHIKNKIQNCTVCHATDKPVKAAPAPLQPIQFPSQPWEKLGIDIVGPVDRAPASQRFFLVLIDYHSKWPEVQATCLQLL